MIPYMPPPPLSLSLPYTNIKKTKNKNFKNRDTQIVINFITN